MAGSAKALTESDARSEEIYPGLQARYGSLRATFTLEGEILARWGMTPDLPAEIEKVVFDMWRRLLSTYSDRPSCTVQGIGVYLCRLSAERDPIQPGKDRVGSGS